MDHALEKRTLGTDGLEVSALGLGCLRAAAVELTSGDLAEIDCAASEVTIVGDRYPAELEQKTNR